MQRSRLYAGYRSGVNPGNGIYITTNQKNAITDIVTLDSENYRWAFRPDTQGTAALD